MFINGGNLSLTESHQVHLRLPAVRKGVPKSKSTRAPGYHLALTLVKMITT